MSEAEQLRDRARAACCGLALVPLPGLDGAHLGVRAVSEARIEELRIDALLAVRARGLEAMPWALGRAIAGRLVAEALVNHETIDEPSPAPFVAADDAGYLDERALDALLAVYTRHVAALRGGPRVA